MEQQEHLTRQIASNECAGLPGVEGSSAGLLTGRSLDLDVHLVDFLSNYTVRGILEGFTPGEATIVLGEPVEEQRAVTVRLNSFAFEGRTLYCRQREDQYEAHISIDDVEATGLRRAPRFPVKLPAHLLLSASGGALAIMIVDISRDGLGIDLTVPLEAGQSIGIECGSVLILAIVRHCRESPNGLFRAGAEMHHLFENNVELPSESPRSSFLQRVWKKRFPKGAGTFSSFPAPRRSEPALRIGR
jgi:hypothetical protein